MDSQFINAMFWNYVLATSKDYETFCEKFRIFRENFQMPKNNLLEIQS